MRLFCPHRLGFQDDYKEGNLSTAMVLCFLTSAASSSGCSGCHGCHASHASLARLQPKPRQNKPSLP